MLAGVSVCLYDLVQRQKPPQPTRSRIELKGRRGSCAAGQRVMESWFSTLKFELGETFPSIRTGKDQLFDYVEVFYNQRRRHSTLVGISPAAFERTTHPKLRWCSPLRQTFHVSGSSPSPFRRRDATRAEYQA